MYNIHCHTVYNIYTEEKSTFFEGRKTMKCDICERELKSGEGKLLSNAIPLIVCSQCSKKEKEVAERLRH